LEVELAEAGDGVVEMRPCRALLVSSRRLEVELAEAGDGVVEMVRAAADGSECEPRLGTATSVVERRRRRYADMFSQ